MTFLTLIVLIFFCTISPKFNKLVEGWINLAFLLLALGLGLGLVAVLISFIKENFTEILKIIPTFVIGYIVLLLIRKFKIVDKIA